MLRAKSKADGSLWMQVGERALRRELLTLRNCTRQLRVSVRRRSRSLITKGLIIRSVLTEIALTVAFFAVITPISIALRLLRKHPLDIRLDSSRRTYWNRREGHRSPFHVFDRF